MSKRLLTNLFIGGISFLSIDGSLIAQTLSTTYLGSYSWTNTGSLYAAYSPVQSYTAPKFNSANGYLVSVTLNLSLTFDVAARFTATGGVYIVPSYVASWNWTNYDSGIFAAPNIDTLMTTLPQWQSSTVHK